MDPTTIYLLLFAGAAIICTIAVLFAPDHKRECPGCGAAVAITRRACQVCRYRFT